MPYILVKKTEAARYHAAYNGGMILAAGITNPNELTVSGMTLLNGTDEDFLPLVSGKSVGVVVEAIDKTATATVAKPVIPTDAEWTTWMTVKAADMKEAEAVIIDR